jgi:tetratricopeptide (TPR) repeat protein
MNSHLVEVYLEAEHDVKNENYVEAFRKYESILFEEPTNAATHNSLGWIYKTQLDDYAKAESHYLAGINGEPVYPHTYHNYAILLMDLERYDDLEKLVQKALDVETVEKSKLYQRLGFARELQLKFEEAITCYEKASLLTLSIEKIKVYREDLERCREKMQLANKYANWLGTVKL